MRYLLLLFILTFCLACSKDKIKPIVDTSIDDEIPVQESWNSTIFFTENGIKKAILYSDHLRTYDEKKETLLDGVQIDFYNLEEEKTSSLTSKQGKVDNATRNMFAIDSVVAVSDSGVTLLTDELMWDNSTRKITTDKFVTIISPEERIEGFGFESDQSLSNYVIYQITYVTQLKEEKK